ncbi:MAG: hypothetical protein ACM3ON_01760 [Chloroflexota bacterium]
MMSSLAAFRDISIGVWLAPDAQRFILYAEPEHEVALDVLQTEHAHASRWQPSPVTAVLLPAYPMSMSGASRLQYLQF